MSNPSSENEDLRALWQAQSQETDPMTLEHIQAISRRLDLQTQRGTIVILLLVAGAFFITGVGWQKAHDLLTQTMYLLYAGGIVGCACVAFRLKNLTRDPTEPGGTFLRRRLEHNLRMSGGRGALLVLAPMTPGFVALSAVSIRNMQRYAPHLRHLTGAQLAMNMLPLLLLAAAWCMTLMIIRPRAMRRLRRDLDELDAAMK